MPAPHKPFVLVAEHCRDDVDMLRSAFERVGRSVRLQLVSDGDQLIRYLDGTGKYRNRARYPTPDLLILDLALPEKNGFEILKWLRDNRRIAQLRVIVLTTPENLRDVSEAYRLGATSFLMKPIDTEDFRNTISAFQDALKQPRQAA